MRDGGAAIVLVPLGILIAAIYLTIYHFVRARQLSRMQAQAPGDVVFTFIPSGWYQAAVVELRSRSVIPPDTLTDSEDPFRRGPRWVAASAWGLRIMRGFGSKPTFSIPWTEVTGVTQEVRRRGGNNNGTRASVTINVRAPRGDIGLVFFGPDSSRRVLITRAAANDVFAELNRLSASTSDPEAAG